MRTKAGKFRQDDYDQNDNFAINKIQKYLLKNNFIIEEKDQEDFDIDIIAHKDGLKYRIEAEVKNTFFTDSDSYPFNTVSFLGRKKKYSNEGLFYYFLLCKKNNSFLYCTSDIIYQEKYKEIKEVNTVHRFGTDVFYRVPKQLCNFRTFNQ